MVYVCFMFKDYPVSPQPSTSTAARNVTGGEPPRKKLTVSVIGANGRFMLPDQPVDEDGGESTYHIEPMQVKHYDLELHKEFSLKKNMAKEVIYEVKFDKEWQDKKIIDVKNDVGDMLQDVIDRAREGLADYDLGRVHINQGNLFQPIMVAPRTLHQLDAEAVK